MIPTFRQYLNLMEAKYHKADDMYDARYENKSVKVLDWNTYRGQVTFRDKAGRIMYLSIYEFEHDFRKRQ